jgi:YD repeat-containing protein
MRTLFGSLALVLGLVGTASGGVSPRNGNYYTFVFDLAGPDSGSIGLVGDKTLSVERTYGWGHEFDAYLVPSADGSVVIHESGGGESTRFAPVAITSEELAMFVNALVSAKVAREPAANGFDAGSYRDKLTTDATFRDSEARGLGQRRELQVGAILWSGQRGSKQSIKREADGYVRDYGNGVRHYFTVKGYARDSGVVARHMRRVEDVYRISRIEQVGPPSIGIDLGYDESRRLIVAKHSDGRFLRFEYGAEGFVAAITNSVGQRATYRYCPIQDYSNEERCGEGDLIESINSAGVIYRYAYDSLHNLVETRERGAVREAVKYGPDGAVRTVIARNGQRSDYAYWADPAAPDLRFRTSVVHTRSDGTRRVEAYEWWAKRRDDGSSYIERELRRSGTNTVDRFYNECCGQTVKQIVNGTETTEFLYDTESRLLVERRTATEIERWRYSSVRRGAVSRYTILSSDLLEIKLEATFEYDRGGNLVLATAPTMERLEVTYDSHSRPVSMRLGDRILTFEYREHTGPVRITLDGKDAAIAELDSSGKTLGWKGEGNLASVIEALSEVSRWMGYSRSEN